MEVHVSLIGRRDLAGEIYRQLRAAILEGRLRGGESLPPTRELARRLSVSRTTVSVAYDRLISEGYAHARVGSGTYVAGNVAAHRGRPGRPPGAIRARSIWDDLPLPTGLWSETEYDFRAGLPDASLFPYQAWRGLVARQLRAVAVGRGVYAHPAGHEGLRASIARHVGVSRGIRVVADDVVVTSGTQQAVDVVARVLVGPGDRVAVEDPGYSPPRRLLETLGLRVAGIPVDAEGLVVEAIPRDTRLVYVSPSHQFPLGMSMSLARRMELLAWARLHDAAILEDDYDSEFRYDGRPIDPLHSLDVSGRVIYVGSFSKSMLPTLRLGFVIVPSSIRAATHAAKYVTDWHTSLPMQGALASFIDDGGFARHVRRMRTVYRARHELVVATVERLLGGELAIVPSSVGLHVSAVARRASVERIHEIVRRAATAGLECQTLAMFAAGGPPRAGVVLGYGSISADRIEAGLSLLRDCFAD